MARFYKELKNLVNNILFSYHGDLSTIGLWIRYGNEIYITSIESLLNICDKNDNQSSVETLILACEKTP